MKKVTSFTAFVNEKGQQLAYSYDDINEDTGATIRENQRGSMTVLPIPKNEDVLAHIAAVNEYLKNQLEASNG